MSSIGRFGRRLFIAGAVAALAFGCAREPPVQPSGQAPAAVAMPDHYSAEVAAMVLADGGNAVDAAVAAAFVLAVTWPEAGNIGGGGFMLARMNGKAVFLDFREVAPAAATRDMYLDAKGEVIDGASFTGHRAIGVPGTVAGLWAAHRKYGTKPWADLLSTAIALAEMGFMVPAQLEGNLRDELPRAAGTTNLAQYFGGLHAGDMFRQPELAATLRRIAGHGPDGFYRGETARLLIDEMRRGGGLITAGDLESYRPVWREPLHARWRKFEVLGAPPPSSGGFAIIQLLKMKDALAARFAGLPLNSPQYIHLTAEMEKRIFADRAEYLGDPDFVPQRAAELITDDYIAKRAAEVNPKAITRAGSVRPGLEPHDTTHFSIVDRSGNAVAITYTLNEYFGSGVVVDGAGFVLNNEMDDFSVKPGVPNFYGVVGSDANAIQAGKRMLSSMAPTMLVSDGKVSMVLGSPGGSTIITTVYQTIVDLLDFHLSAEEAVAATRFHHQLWPEDLITYSISKPLPKDVVNELVRRGYRVEPHPWEIGDMQLIWREGSEWRAASDPRGRGESRIIP